jgi:hypothetical protein
VAAVRNVQAEALAGIPIATSFAYGAHYKPFHDDATFQQALALYLMAAEKHSRFGYVRFHPEHSRHLNLFHTISAYHRVTTLLYNPSRT